MTTLTEQPPSDDLAVFRKQDAIVAGLRDKYMALTIAGVDDRKGFEAVHKARMHIVQTRTNVDKTRKQLKADVLERGRLIDAEAKRVTSLLAPIEEHLEAEETAVTNERERLKREAEEARQRKMSERTKTLQSLGYTGDIYVAVQLADENFAKVLKDAGDVKAERDRLAEQERQQAAAESARLKQLEAEDSARRALEQAAADEARRKKEESLAKLKADLEEIDRQQQERAAKLRAEQQRLADQEAEQRRKAELEQARKDAAERARVETEQRLAREAAEKQAAEQRRLAQEKADAAAAEAARRKAESERPQREKLLAVASLVDAIEIPDGAGSDGVANVLLTASQKIRAIANGPLE